MTEFIIWGLAGFLIMLFAGIILGFVGASVYDAWYQRKYATWIALQEDHNRPQRPVAK